MKIIPVIDILNGIVVHGKKGKRKQYKPLTSQLSISVNPIEIARIFKKIGFNDLYLADLDSIMGNSTNFRIYPQIIKKLNLNLMVDAGISDITKAEKVIETGISNIIIGSETLNNLNFVKKSIRKFGQNRIIVSVDIKKGKLLSSSKKINSMSVIQFIQRIEKLGIKIIIFLDLDLVGTQSGINFELIKKILKMTKMKIIVGGGIKDIQELKILRKFGIYGVLIATLLHNEKNVMDELRNFGFL
jgi:phosphoribosylformimino-5-aminoimidazole carboxamide ribotide isomerase